MDIELYFPNMTSTLQITGCGCGVKPPGWSFPAHHHHLFELLYCFGGAAVHHANGQAVPFRKGDWFWIKAGVKHGTDNDGPEPYTFFNIHFDIDDPELRKTLSSADFGLLPHAEAEQTGLPALVERIERMMADSLPALASPLVGPEPLPPLTLRPGQKLELQAVILLMIQQIVDRLPQTFRAEAPVPAQPPVTTSLETDVAHRIEERLRLMALGLAGNSIESIARELHMSRSQCTKTFTKVYGVSPRGYVSRLVTNRAKELLVTTSMSVEEIAFGLGFRSVSHFSRQFRRWTGLSPLQYRPKGG
ncbi:helix-turn-helix domain-containing protein [Paenibacillus hodogayensis]|uniref:Helix-turn-helix domain-containing protein n=1 Tax=Paenibacillus hodogayensis TaxID=279208 RepID=A0ABV5VQX9_9BACL